MTVPPFYRKSHHCTPGQLRDREVETLTPGRVGEFLLKLILLNFI